MAKYSVPELRAIHDLPIPDLIHRAQQAHRQHHLPNEVQLCSLLSVKTGGCSEDCAYCPQSNHYDTGLQRSRTLEVAEVVAAARRAQAAGATRFCMGTAGRNPQSGEAFATLLAIVRAVRGLGMEACLTLGMLDDEQAARLAEAGLTIYNHNVNTSREFYGKIVTTHSYDDRLATLRRVSRAGIKVCSGGIIGMGESIDDRCAMLATLANLEPSPESVPINALVPIKGTPLAERPPVDPLEMVRMIATARIAMPAARVRLSAGRAALSREAQVLCFVAGANSIFFGEKLLTTGNADVDSDHELLRDAGLRPAPPGH
ncbi:MAG: biotin synthase BioB [Deltaproteobacteria bacterium]|nr:biotin synthase BioB [Deltaproteobacteria bacterium]